MRIPPAGRFSRFYQAASIFVLGMIVGSVLYNSLYHAAYNNIWEKNQDLEVKISQYEEDIKHLKKYSKQPTVIKEIKIRVEQKEEPLDSIIVKEIIQRMGKDLTVLRGRSIFDIDTDSKLTRSLLDDKSYTVRERDYKVKIRTMLVMEGVLQIWVDING